MERKFLRKPLEQKDFTHKDATRAERFWIVIHTDGGGYVENDYTVHVWSNGDFTISDNDGEGFISMHGEIAQAVTSFLGSERKAP